MMAKSTHLALVALVALVTEVSWAGQATVSFLKGKATVTASSEQLLSLGGIVKEGATVSTFKETRLELKLEDGSVIRLGPFSTMVLKVSKSDAASGRTTEVDLKKGRGWLNVAKAEGTTFKVSTPSAVAAVKGTVFRLEVDNTGSQVNVYDGEVAVEKGGDQILLKKDEMVLPQGGKPVPFTAEDDQRQDQDGWIAWNKSRDKIRVVVAVAAYKKNVLQDFEMADAQNYIMEKLGRHYLFQVIDRQQLEELKAQERLKEAMKTNDQAKIAAAGLALGVDVVVNVPIQYSEGVSVVPQFKTVTAKMSEKALRADTAEPLAIVNWTQPEVARGADVTEEAAAWKAIKPQLDSMTDQLVVQMKKQWTREAKQGVGIQVLVTRTDFKSLNALVDALGGLAGVKRVEQQYLVGDRALLNVTTSLDSQALAKVLEGLPAYTGTVVGISLYRLEVELKKP